MRQKYLTRVRVKGNIYYFVRVRRGGTREHSVYVVNKSFPGRDKAKALKFAKACERKYG